MTSPLVTPGLARARSTLAGILASFSRVSESIPAGSCAGRWPTDALRVMLPMLGRSVAAWEAALPCAGMARAISRASGGNTAAGARIERRSERRGVIVRIVCDPFVLHGFAACRGLKLPRMSERRLHLPSGVLGSALSLHCEAGLCRLPRAIYQHMHQAVDARGHRPG